MIYVMLYVILFPGALCFMLATKLPCFMLLFAGESADHSCHSSDDNDAVVWSESDPGTIQGRGEREEEEEKRRKRRKRRKRESKKRKGRRRRRKGWQGGVCACVRACECECARACVHAWPCL
jgi:hypothetical protein